MTVRQRFRNIAQNLGLLVFSAAGALVAVEVFLRLVPGLLPGEALLRMHWQAFHTPQTESVRHPYIGFAYPANWTGARQRGDVSFSYRLDERGFRNLSPWPDTADVVVLGDSWVFGWTDDDSEWLRQVDDSLGQTSVVNLGLIGAGPEQYTRVYETYGRELMPKVLMFGLFPGNDLLDMNIFRRWLAAGSPGNYAVWAFFGGTVPTAPSLLERSYLVRLLREVRRNRGLVLTPSMSFPDGSRLRFAPGVLESSVALALPGSPDFEETFAAIERARRLAQEDGAHFLVLLFPTKEEVYLDLIGGEPPQLVAPMVAELERRGIPHLDFTPHFRDRAKAGERLFFEVDGHANQQGYDLMARVLLAHLREQAVEYGLPDHTQQ